MEYWSGRTWPAHSALIRLQHREPSHLKQVPQPENLGLMGRPERHARPSWLAPSQRRLAQEPNGQRPATTKSRERRLMIAAAAAADGDGNSSFPADSRSFHSGSRRRSPWYALPPDCRCREPPATASFILPAKAASACCAECGHVHPPVMDEYYFWLVNSEYYDPRVLNPADPSLYQDVDWGVTPPDMTSDWHRRDRLPQLLTWPKRPMVKLAWCRVTTANSRHRLHGRRCTRESWQRRGAA